MRSCWGAFLKSVIAAGFCLSSPQIVSPATGNRPKKRPGLLRALPFNALPSLPPEQLLPGDAVFDRRHRQEHQNDAKADQGVRVDRGVSTEKQVGSGAGKTEGDRKGGEFVFHSSIFRCLADPTWVSGEDYT